MIRDLERIAGKILAVLVCCFLLFYRPGEFGVIAIILALQYIRV